MTFLTCLQFSLFYKKECKKKAVYILDGKKPHIYSISHDTFHDWLFTYMPSRIAVRIPYIMHIKNSDSKYKLSSSSSSSSWASSILSTCILLTLSDPFADFGFGKHFCQLWAWFSCLVPVHKIQGVPLIGLDVLSTGTLGLRLLWHLFSVFRRLWQPHESFHC